jgi:hypothetical protein
MKIDAPSILKSSNHWVLRNGKKPVNREGVPTSWTNSSTWIPFNVATESLQSSPDKFSGLGYIVHHDPLQGDNQIIGGELDNCRDPITGWVSPWAQSILSTISACTSISISGCGFIFFCLGKLPDTINKVVGHGPEDLTAEAKINILDKKPKIKDRLAAGESAWNEVQIYEHGPRYLTITGEWLPGYPEDLPNRTSELQKVIAPFLQEETPEEAPKKITVPTEPSAPEDPRNMLPFLSILQVINTLGFAKEGDELVGSHPIFVSSDGNYLRVNLSKNSWRYVHAGNEVSGDPWMWLACECGAVPWEDCDPGAISDELVLGS